jgi:hypothetical protein
MDDVDGVRVVSARRVAGKRTFDLGYACGKPSDQQSCPILGEESGLSDDRPEKSHANPKLLSLWPDKLTAVVRAQLTD